MNGCGALDSYRPVTLYHLILYNMVCFVRMSYDCFAYDSARMFVLVHFLASVPWAPREGSGSTS